MKTITRDTYISLALSLPVLAWVLYSGQSIPWSLKAVAVYLIFAPVAEETIFRGGLLELLLYKMPASWPKVTANIIVSLLFALAHLVTRREYGALLVFFPSLVLGWHYGRHKSLPAVIFIHFFYNFILFL